VVRREVVLRISVLRISVLRISVLRTITVHPSRFASSGCIPSRSPPPRGVLFLFLILGRRFGFFAIVVWSVLFLLLAEAAAVIRAWLDVRGGVAFS
jgi:hypothetical protein